VNRTGQGEAVASWSIWALVTLEVLVTYSLVDPAETYHVSHDGLTGGSSRAVTLANYPIALVAVSLALVAVAALPRRAWWAAGPAIALCATLPFVIDQDDLDARWVNALPALGVLLAGALTVAAVGRAGASFAGREKDGTGIAAVHLGHHHGMDGALLLLTAVLLSRIRVEPGRLRIAVYGYLGAMLTYGAANFVQDAWGEQVVKRGWTDTGIP
jgi:hypothetical protein